MNVPWMSKDKIATAATRVIEAYASKLKHCIQPPIPVENILERGLGLQLAFIDLRKKLGMDDVLGATYVRKKLICVDQSLVDSQHEGRLCFTFAHEAGHWVLHRALVAEACRTDIGKRAFIFCRSRQAKEPIEWQADYFASCLLMPEEAVKQAFYQCYGSKPLVLYNVKSAYSGPVCFDPCVENWPLIAAMIKDTGGFANVSKQAMILRLQDLGLVKNETRARLAWSESR